MKIVFHKDRFKSELEKKLKPSGSWWSFFGIVLFFIVPELIASVWGEKIDNYTTLMQEKSSELYQQLWYKFLNMMFSEVSFLNLMIGFGMIYWFYHVRKKSSHDSYNNLL